MDKLTRLLNNKNVKKVLYAPFKIRLASLVAIFVVVFFLSYNFFVAPEFDQVAKIERDIKNAEGSISLAILREKNTEKLKEQIQKLKAFNQSKRVDFPERISIPMLLSVLEDNFANAGVKLNTISNTSVIHDDYLGLYAVNFRASLVTEYSGLIKVFAALMQMDEITIISSLNIQRKGLNKLNVNLDIRTYSQQGV